MEVSEFTCCIESCYSTSILGREKKIYSKEIDPLLVLSSLFDVLYYWNVYATW